MVSCAFFVPLRRCKSTFPSIKRELNTFFLLVWYLPGWRLLLGSEGKAQGLKRGVKSLGDIRWDTEGAMAESDAHSKG